MMGLRYWETIKIIRIPFFWWFSVGSKLGKGKHDYKNSHIAKKHSKKGYANDFNGFPVSKPHHLYDGKVWGRSGTQFFLYSPSKFGHKTGFTARKWRARSRRPKNILLSGFIAPGLVQDPTPDP